jgi:hypothetical protein
MLRRGAGWQAIHLAPLAGIEDFESLDIRARQVSLETSAMCVNGCTQSTALFVTGFGFAEVMPSDPSEVRAWTEQSPSSAIVHSCRNALQLRWCGRASASTVCAHPSTSCPIGAENPSRSIRTGVGRGIVHSVRPAVRESICLAATILAFSTPDGHRATQTSARACWHSTGRCTRAACASRMWLVPRLCSCRAADMCSVRIVSVGSAPFTSRRALCRCAAARTRHHTRRVGRERCRACV